MTRKRSGTIPAGKKISPLKRHGKNWVMAVDPFGSLDIAPVRDLAVPLAEKSDANIYAAYVLAPASFNWTGEFSGPWVKKFKPMAEDKLKELFPLSVITPTVVPCRESGRRASVKALLSFAQKLKAECIVLSTHTRSGLEHLTMGSFAETLILASKIPVLVVNPERHVPSVIRRILVTVDFGRRCEKYVASVADYARQIDAEIVLYHKQPDPLDPIVQQGVYSLGGGWVSVQNYIEEDLQVKTKHLAKLEAIVSKKGVTVSQLLDSGPEDLIASINQASEIHTADMVTVLTEAGSWSAALLGSVARGLVRTSSIPVMVRR